MKSFLFFYFVLFLNFYSVAQVNCSPCNPLAEVAITNSGLERLLEVSLNKNFDTFNEKVINQAGFRDLKMDYDIDPSCKPSSIEGAVKKKLKGAKESCFGLPDLTDSTIGSDTKLRPYHAGLSNLNLDKLKLKLASPIKCEKLECEFKVAVQDLKVSGDLEVLFKDGKKENFIPKSRFNIDSTDSAKLTYSMKAYIDPKTGQLKDTVFIKDKSSAIEVGAGSLKTHLNMKTDFKSEADKINLYQKYYASKNKFTKLSKDPNFAENSFKEMRQKMISQLAADPEYDNLKHNQIEKIVDEVIDENLGGRKEIVQKLKAVQWPNPKNPNQVNEFINNPPDILKMVPDFKDQITLTKFYAVAENSGYSNVDNALFAQGALSVGHFLHQSDTFNSAILKPALEKEIIPTVESQVNAEMRNLPEYWKQISEIPNLNVQNLIDFDENKNQIEKLQKEIATVGILDPSKKAKLEKTLNILLKKQSELNHKMNNDWMPIDTTVLVDKNARSLNMIRGNIMKNDPNCADVTPKFSDRAESDFDISTKINTGTLQQYMNAMAESKKLDMCLGGENPKTCKGGTKVTLDQPPKISCENGQLVVDANAEIKKKILFFTASPDAAAKIKMTVQNCNGDPCIQYMDTDGKFKNVFMNLFLGSLLDRGISSALNTSNKTSVHVPDVKLKKTTTNKNTCETTMDWMIQSPFSASGVP